jgi:hypothetical protein
MKIIDQTGVSIKQGLPELSERAIICPLFILSGRSAVRLARLHGVQEVPGSTPGAPTRDRMKWGKRYVIGPGVLVTLKSWHLGTCQ